MVRILFRALLNTHISEHHSKHTSNHNDGTEAAPLPVCILSLYSHARAGPGCSCFTRRCFGTHPLAVCTFRWIVDAARRTRI